MPRLKSLMAGLVAAACIAAISPPSVAQVFYMLNGRPAPPEIARYMAQNGLPAGHYWLNRDGYWGVVGNPQPLGNIYAGAPPGTTARRPSLSERGMLYRPGEILDGR
jgi:hypothetical protein